MGTKNIKKEDKKYFDIKEASFVCEISVDSIKDMIREKQGRPSILEPNLKTPTPGRGKKDLFSYRDIILLMIASEFICYGISREWLKICDYFLNRVTDDIFAAIMGSKKGHIILSSFSMDCFDRPVYKFEIYPSYSRLGGLVEIVDYRLFEVSNINFPYYHIYNKDPLVSIKVDLERIRIKVNSNISDLLLRIRRSKG